MDFLCVICSLLGFPYSIIQISEWLSRKLCQEPANFLCLLFVYDYISEEFFWVVSGLGGKSPFLYGSGLPWYMPPVCLMAVWLRTFL